jgi:hypothetical protein
MTGRLAAQMLMSRALDRSRCEFFFASQAKVSIAVTAKSQWMAPTLAQVRIDITPTFAMLGRLPMPINLSHRCAFLASGDLGDFERTS